MLKKWIASLWKLAVDKMAEFVVVKLFLIAVSGTSIGLLLADHDQEKPAKESTQKSANQTQKNSPTAENQLLSKKTAKIEQPQKRPTSALTTSSQASPSIPAAAAVDATAPTIPQELVRFVVSDSKDCIISAAVTNKPKTSERAQVTFEYRSYETDISHKLENRQMVSYFRCKPKVTEAKRRISTIEQFNIAE